VERRGARNDEATERRMTGRRASGMAVQALALALACSTAQPAAATVRDAAPLKADRVVVVKSERRLYLLRGEEVVRSFRVALGRQPRGTKLRQGDGRTPEGLYRLEAGNPDTRFHRSIRISYPNDEDVARAQASGTRPGGNIMLHGVPAELSRWGPDHWMFNWTEGCIAVTNEEMDIIWRSVDLGTPIEIRP
jgi:murein L,D-transpeptidase YafK